MWGLSKQGHPTHLQYNVNSVLLLMAKVDACPRLSIIYVTLCPRSPKSQAKPHVPVPI